MNPRTKKIIDNRIFDYLENEEPYWLMAIISTATEILEEKLEARKNKGDEQDE
jgi:hypothetical protein